jgi:hypothetical protein
MDASDEFQPDIILGEAGGGGPRTVYEFQLGQLQAVAKWVVALDAM